MKKEVKFERRKNKIKDLTTGETTKFDSINLAKKESRKLQGVHGLGSLIKIK